MNAEAIIKELTDYTKADNYKLVASGEVLLAHYRPLLLIVITKDSYSASSMFEWFEGFQSVVDVMPRSTYGKPVLEKKKHKLNRKSTKRRI